jgi:membrane-associated phospholipid phosphatase
MSWPKAGYDLGQRIARWAKTKRYLWVAHGVIAILVILAVSLLYDPVGRLQEAQILAGLRPVYRLATPLDLIIPLLPMAMIVYWYVFYAFLFFSFFFFAFVRRELRNAFVLAFMIVSFAAYATYLLFSVTGPDRLVTGTDFFSVQVALLYQHDTPLNCFPSLHGSTSLLAAYVLWRTKKTYGFVSWPIAIAIQISTLFVRQHWIADQLGAALVTLPIAYLTLNWFKYTKVPAELGETRWWQIVAAIGFALVFVVLYLFAFYVT